MMKLINKAGAFLYFFMFTGLVVFTVWGFWQLSPLIVFYYLTMMVLMFVRSAFKIKNWLTNHALSVMLSIDQHWQVTFSPLLNLGVKTKHKFGKEDETASSVVGKNLKATGGLHWMLIELLLSMVLEGGRPHAVPSIEDDE